jgi:hypothetical protein
VIRLRLGHAPEPDHADAFQRNRIPPHEGVVAVLALHERTVGALVNEHEAILARLDARVQARHQVALDHEVIFLAAPECRVGALAMIEHELRAEVAQPDAEFLLQLADRRDRRQHAGRLAVLPQYLVDRDLAMLAARNRDVHLPRNRAPLLGEAPEDRIRDDDLPRLGLAGHAVGRVHGGTENVAGLEHHRAEMAANADRNVLPFDFQVRVAGDGRLHFHRGIHRLVAVTESGEDLIAHGLDHGAAVLLGGALHDVDADRDFVACGDVAEHLEQARAADDVGEEDREFLFLAHWSVGSPPLVT